MKKYHKFKDRSGIKCNVYGSDRMPDFIYIYIRNNKKSNRTQSLNSTCYSSRLRRIFSNCGNSIFKNDLAADEATNLGEPQLSRGFGHLNKGAVAPRMNSPGDARSYAKLTLCNIEPDGKDFSQLVCELLGWISMWRSFMSRPLFVQAVRRGVQCNNKKKKALWRLLIFRGGGILFGLRKQVVTQHERV